MPQPSNRVLAGLILGFGLAASVLILTIPALFDAPSPLQMWFSAVFAGITVGLGTLLTLIRRPPRPSAE